MFLFLSFMALIRVNHWAVLTISLRLLGTKTVLVLLLLLLTLLILLTPRLSPTLLSATLMSRSLSLKGEL
jgi:hypothetical protein